MQTKQVEQCVVSLLSVDDVTLTLPVSSTTPVLNDVKDITLVQASRSGLNALISYEHDVCFECDPLMVETGDSLARQTLHLGTTPAMESRTDQGLRSWFDIYSQNIFEVREHLGKNKVWSDVPFPD